MLKRLWRAYGMNPFDRLVRKAKRAQSKRFLICWNRGLGDIALGMYALVYRIRRSIPDAKIAFLTRPDLAEGFSLLEGVDVLIDSAMQRKSPFDLDACLAKHSLTRSDFDLVVEQPDPTYWLKWQLGTLVPRLQWNPAWDQLHSRFSIDLEKRYLGVHVQTETTYGYEKNWPLEHWRALFEQVHAEMGIGILLFGNAPSSAFEMSGVIDLRGKTSLSEMLALIKQSCSWLVVPDSGILSLTYFLDCSFPLNIVSLWSDPHQGVLKQNVASPNSELVHVPLIAPKGDLRKVSVGQVMDALFYRQYDRVIKQRQQEFLMRRHAPIPLEFSPLEQYAEAGRADDVCRGQERIAAGKAGCILLAGGQGTRLGHPGPKGMVPVSPIKGKSLFQLFAERVLEASAHAGRPLPLAIMTSPLNDAETRRYFEENSYFGLAPSQVDFFEQPVLPLCDEQGHWLFKTSTEPLCGPDGNGHVFHAFTASGLWKKWQKSGVECVSVIPVDNPLADPFDPELVGFQARCNADVVVKAVERKRADEKMGVVVFDKKIRVVEYTELKPEDAAAVNEEGKLKYRIANAGLFCFHSSFIDRVVQERMEMPWHLAHKIAHVKGKAVAVWKFETFIFDLLVHAQTPAVLLYPREQVYSPLKNAEGEKSLETVRAALQSLGID